MAADIDRLLRACREQGEVVRRTKRGRWVVRGPYGTTTLPNDPRKANRGWDNSVAGLKRIGIRVP